MTVEFKHKYNWRNVYLLGTALLHLLEITCVMLCSKEKCYVMKDVSLYI